MGERLSWKKKYKKKYLLQPWLTCPLLSIHVKVRSGIYCDTDVIELSRYQTTEHSAALNFVDPIGVLTNRTDADWVSNEAR